MNWLDRIEQNVPVVQSADPIWKAAEYMKSSQLNEIPVLSGQNFIGIIHARDLLNTDSNRIVEEYIDKDCVSVDGTEAIYGLPCSNTHQIIPIVKDGIYYGSIKWNEIQRCLQDELNQLMLVIDNSYDGILITDETGYILHINKEFEQITLLNKEVMVGAHMNDMVDKGLFLNDSVVMKTLQSGRSYTNVQKYKNTGIYTLVTATPVCNQKGELIRVLANVRDVSDLTRLQEQLAESKNLPSRYQTELKQVRIQNIKSSGEVIAYSQEMLDVLDLVYHVASSDSTILLLGESGVGKEVIGKVLHENSLRFEKGLFVKVNCGAIPPNLLEAELFGYEQGAFTGAKKAGKQGIFELANNGTLFLDEIGELPLDMQVKFLRVLQEQELIRVGGTQTIKINVRVIAATNRNLERMVEEGTFRLDLYYRLNIIPITIPPLRERKDDITPLLGYFLKKFNEKHQYSKRLSKEVVDQLLMYKFPGNVRELSNIVERLVLTCRAKVIKLKHLPNIVSGCNEIENKLKIQEGKPDVDLQILKLSCYGPAEGGNLVDLEKEALIQALKKYGSVRKAGKAIGVTHTMVLKKMKEFGVTLNAVR
ncbi:sigma 54-interacting transcriptional regulator [Peribacillus sp. NPDC101481]|uniref:sigma 54-interacting transcriptional regulator n=1 Tax=unclassified Peribacillus TaxID=2675266 RepID=UPI003822A17A